MKHRRVEIGLLLCRFTAYLPVLLWLSPAGMALAVVRVQVGAVGILLGGAFAPNHIVMPVVWREVKVDFLRRQVLMTRNIAGGPLVRFVIGGLEHQSSTTSFPAWPGRTFAAPRSW